MLDLPTHGQNEKNDPVHDENRPENWNIEKFEPGTEKPDRNGSGRAVPKFELWQPSNEWSELLIGLGW